MIVRVVMLSAIFLAGASASATAEISDGGRLGIGQGANYAGRGRAAKKRKHRLKVCTRNG